MFGLEEPYLYIKVIFVGFSLVLWLEISGEKKANLPFLQKLHVSTGTES